MIIIDWHLGTISKWQREFSSNEESSSKGGSLFELGLNTGLVKALVE